MFVKLPLIQIDMVTLIMGIVPIWQWLSSEAIDLQLFPSVYRCLHFDQPYYHSFIQEEALQPLYRVREWPDNYISKWTIIHFSIICCLFSIQREFLEQFGGSLLASGSGFSYLINHYEYEITSFNQHGRWASQVQGPVIPMGPFNTY